MPIFVPLTERGQHVAYMGYCSSGGTTVTFKSTLYPASALANASVAKIIDVYRNKVVRATVCMHKVLRRFSSFVGRIRSAQGWNDALYALYIRTSRVAG